MNSESLKVNRLFSGLNDPELDELTQGCVDRQVHLGAELFQRGAPTTAIYFIEMGSLKLVSKERKGMGEVVVVGPGKLLGEYGFIDRTPHTATAVALESMRVGELPYTVLEAWGKKFPESFQAVLWAISRALLSSFRKLPEDLSTLHSFKLRLQ